MDETDDREGEKGSAPATPLRPSRAFSVTRLTLRPASSLDTGVAALQRQGECRAADARAEWTMLGALLANGLQAIGGAGLERQIRNAIEHTHAQTIRAIHARGLGALVVIRTKEWRREDASGMRATALVDIRIHAGASPEDALNAYQAKSSSLSEAGDGWRMREPEFLWIG